MQKIKQTSTFIGISEIVEMELIYTRPSRQGRQIFGSLVPYGDVWRTGADGNTMITFSHDLSISGHTLTKGKYAIFTVPQRNTWRVIFYKHTGNYGLPRPIYRKDIALMFDVESVKLENIVNVFTIDITEKLPGVADLRMSWEYTMATITADFSAGLPFEQASGSSDGVTLNDYYNSAKFHFEETGNLVHALRSLNVLLEMNVTYFYLALKSRVLAKSGNIREAIRVAKDSLTLAQEYGNERYIALNKANLTEWEKSLTD